jgi:hypothetical protein
MRREKDQTIRDLTDQLEQQRDTYERRINELDQIIKCKFNFICLFQIYIIRLLLMDH